VGYLIYLRRKCRSSALGDWAKVGIVEKLFIYPVKSMKGIEVDQMECTRIGPCNGDVKDRHFMVMDRDSGKLITGRQLPLLVTFTAHIEHGSIVLHNKNSTVQISLAQIIETNQIHRVEHHRGKLIDGLDCGQEISEWLKKELNTEMSLSLIYFVYGMYTERDVVTQKQWMISDNPSRHEPIAYSDQGPYNILSSSSISDLNAQFNPQRQFTVQWFRPSILVSQSPPFDEDKWGEIRIGDVTFTNIMPCNRCVMTLIDPMTGQRSEDNQPLKKLREYRLAPMGKLRDHYKDTPIFGAVLALNCPGTIEIGDTVFVRYKQHPF